MKIEKLSNSTYRLRKMYKGKTYTVITDYKPTDKEATILMADEMKRRGMRNGSMTFGSAATDYIETKNNVLSPATVREYKTTLKQIPQSFKNLRLSDIDQQDVQRYINTYAKNHAPKTTANMNGFITGVIGAYVPGVSFRIKLPQKQIKPEYVPTDDDVRRILERAKGTRYEIPLWLAVYGLRRSEICALDVSDLVGNTITVCKGKVKNEANKWVVKPYPKNETSNRTVVVTDYLADLIRTTGHVFDGHPGMIYKALQKYQKELGIPSFPLHKLRHYFASFAHAEGIPDVYIMALGGWKTDYVMKSVYRHAFDEKKAQSQDAINAHFQKNLSNILSTSDANP